jgi:hypothetical protein
MYKVKILAMHNRDHDSFSEEMYSLLAQVIEAEVIEEQAGLVIVYPVRTFSLAQLLVYKQAQYYFVEKLDHNMKVIQVDGYQIIKEDFLLDVFQ